MNNKITKSVEKEENVENLDENSPKTPEILQESKKTKENKRTEKPEETQGLVECKHCKNLIEPFYDGSINRWRCPDCNKMVSSPFTSSSEMIAETKPQKGQPYQILSSRNIKFSGNELAQAEMLIESGVAKNFNDLAKKAFNILFLKEKVNKAFGVGSNAMELNESKQDDTSEIIDRSLKQQLLQAQIDNMKKGGQQGQTSDPLSTMMLMRMMENQDKGKSGGDNGFMNQLMMMQMQAMAKPQTDSNLRGEIAELKHQMQMQQMMNQQAQMQQGNTSSQQFMQQMEAIRAERDKEIKAAEIMAQQERDKNLSLAFDNRRIELESRLQGMEKELKERGSGQVATQRIKQMKEEIAAIKEMSQELGESKKGAGEYISETVTNVASQLQPALTKYMEQKEQQRSMQQQMQQLPPEPSPIEHPIQNPEPQPSDMTESERQMAEQNYDMYIKPSGDSE